MKYTGLIIMLIIVSSLFAGEIRTYIQIKDVATQETGKVQQSQKKADLFEYTYDIDVAQKVVTRIKIRRLDEETPREDATRYDIMQQRQIISSHIGNGGDSIIAIQQGGGELLELGNQFAFTSRVSPFSQVISGVYRRVR